MTNQQWTMENELRSKAREELGERMPAYPVADFEVVQDIGAFTYAVLAQKQDEYLWTLYPGEMPALLASDGELHFLNHIPFRPGDDKMPRDWKRLPLRLVIVRRKAR